MAIASSSLSGCGGMPFINRPMYTEDLNGFQIDCRKRDEQIRFLLGQLSSRDDRLLSWWTNYWDPMGVIKPSDDYQLRANIYSRMSDWHVHQNLKHIYDFCG